MTITRIAVFEGVFSPGKEEAFFLMVEDRLAHLWRQFPSAQNARWFRVNPANEGAR